MTKANIMPLLKLKIDLLLSQLPEYVGIENTPLEKKFAKIKEQHFKDHNGKRVNQNTIAAT